MAPPPPPALSPGIAGAAAAPPGEPSPTRAIKRKKKAARKSPPKEAKANGGTADTARETAPEMAPPRMADGAGAIPENGYLAMAGSGVGGPAAANGAGEHGVSMAERWNRFLQSFKDAVYTFNVPSPIKVDEPKTIHLWVDTMSDQQALAKELEKMVVKDSDRVEAGAIQVSPEMRATLTGENFIINANSPEQQRINMAGRTIWSWDITPTWPGTLTLHLRLIAIPPDKAEPPYTIPALLDRTIEVKVTFWWLLDHFFEKYWKWLLGGLGTLFMTILGWRRQKRTGQKE